MMEDESAWDGCVPRAAGGCAESGGEEESRNTGWYAVGRKGFLSVAFSAGKDHNEQLSTCSQTACHLTDAGGLSVPQNHGRFFHQGE